MFIPLFIKKSVCFPSRTLEHMPFFVESQLVFASHPFFIESIGLCFSPLLARETQASCSTDSLVSPDVVLVLRVAYIRLMQGTNSFIA
jgi:hypothetical protein